MSNIEPTDAEIAAGLDLELNHPELFDAKVCPRCGGELSPAGLCENAPDW